MTVSIAFAGKGGTGKTTLAGLLVRYLIENSKKPVLAVDADSNANFNEVLGVEVKETLGHAREQMKVGVAQGMTKDMFMEMKIEEAIVENDDFDLIVMGQPEGPGCYCAANSLLVKFLDRLIVNYPYVVIDNEAGMEHLSRLTTNNVDILLAVSDSSRRGILSAARIVDLSSKLHLNIKHKYLIINLAKEGQEDILKEQVAQYDLDLIGIIPEDSEVRKFDLEGKPTIQLPKDSVALNAAYSIFDRIMDVL